MSIEGRVKKAVALGASKCDEMVSGWHNDIDKEKLSITCVSHCICGQLAGESGDYMAGLEKLGLTSASAVSHGFTLLGVGTAKELKKAWVEEIDARILTDEFARDEVPGDVLAEA